MHEARTVHGDPKHTAHEMMNMVITRLTCDFKPFSNLAISIILIVVFQYVT